MSFENSIERLRGSVRDIPDFPKPGILFRDITPILLDPELLEISLAVYASSYKNAKIDKVIGIESRGFIFAPSIAIRLGAGFIPIRKIGKLPSKTIHTTYALEYGTATMEVHSDSIKPGERVIIVDDLIATGGSAAAAVNMIRELGGEIVGASFLIELQSLNGRLALGSIPVHTHIVY